MVELVSIDRYRRGRERKEGNRGQGQDRVEDKLLRREERKERDTGGQSEAYI